MKFKNSKLFDQHDMTVSKEVVIDADQLYMASFIITSSVALGSLTLYGANSLDGNRVSLDATAITATTYHVKLDQVHTRYLILDFVTGGAGVLTVDFNGKGA